MLTRLFLFSTALAVSSLAFSQNEEGLQTSQLKASISNGNLELRVTIPCGSKFFALVAQSSPDGKNLRLGGLIKRHTVSCAALPTIHAIKIKGFQNNSYSSLTLMEPENYRAPLTVYEANELRLVRGKSPLTSRIEATFSMGCGQNLGLLLKPTSDQRLEIGSLEIRKSKRAGTCQERHQKIVLRGPIIGTARHVIRLPVQQQQATEAYVVKLAPIDGASMTVKNGNMTFTYLRRCNESPVGVVLGPEQGGKRQVGLAVAFFYNQACNGVKAPYFKSRYTTRHLKFSAHERLTLFNPKELGELSVSRPYAIWLSDNASRDFTIGHYETCNRLIGTLLSYNMQGKAYLGLIEKPTFKTCKKPLKELSFIEPALTSRPSAPEILRFFSRS